MITHAARTLHDQPASTPDGMPVARCGWQNDGHGIAVAWERRFIDCPMCLLMIDSIPVTPGTEHFMRTPRRPDYVPEGHIYVPPEFQPRRPNILGILLLAVMALAAILTVVALVATWKDNVGSSPAPAPLPGVITPTTYGPPPS
jgi:hypothetical protein